MCDERKILAYCKRMGYSLEYARYWAEHPFDEALYPYGVITESVAPHHILSRGAHGNIDESWNLLALSRESHARIHTIGPQEFALAFPHLHYKITQALKKELDKGDDIE